MNKKAFSPLIPHDKISTNVCQMQFERKTQCTANFISLHNVNADTSKTKRAIGASTLRIKTNNSSMEKMSWPNNEKSESGITIFIVKFS